MLYVTTRTDRDSYTPHRAMTADLAPDGGQFLPIQVPRLTGEALAEVAGRSFNENIAAVLNLLYRRNLTGRDIELAVGRQSMTLLELNSRTLIAELWHNYDSSYDEYVLGLFRMLVKDPEPEPGVWFRMSVRIAQLFGVFGKMMARGIVSEDRPLDIAVPSFDFRLPMAAWYARSWGLPIGTIICCCNENNAPWCLLHQGEMRTDATLRHTCTEACDQTVPGGLEHLISQTLGADEACQFAAAVKAGRPYHLEAEQQAQLRAGFSVSVVSQRRMEFMIPNIYREERWYPDLYTAMAYTGLVDHRAAPGDTGKALVIAWEDPAANCGVLARMLGTRPDDLARRLQKS